MFILSENIVPMLSTELKAFISELGISQADFARLVGVTSRAVTLWLAEERAIPGPVESYVRLLQMLPGSLKYIELSRLKEKGTGMRDGMYGIALQGQQGAGMGMLIFDNGRIYGTDTEGVRYDGEYVFHETSGLADVKVKVTFPPNVKAVFGISNPYEWSFDVTTALNPMRKSGQLSLKTSLGKPINAQFVFLRTLPEAA
jgi:transcriptional regulator with XRE-family HTH domain